MGNIKQIDIKNHTIYFFNDMINNKDLHWSLIKIDKKSYKNIGIYILVTSLKTIDDYENINGVNLLYVITGKANGYIEENNGNKYLVFISTDGNKNILAKLTKLWDDIKHFIETINEGKKDEYEKDFMKIKLNSDDNLPLNKMLKLHMLTVTVRSVFGDNSKYYSQVFLDECLYKL